MPNFVELLQAINLTLGDVNDTLTGARADLKRIVEIARSGRADTLRENMATHLRQNTYTWIGQNDTLNRLTREISAEVERDENYLWDDAADSGELRQLISSMEGCREGAVRYRGEFQELKSDLDLWQGKQADLTSAALDAQRQCQAFADNLKRWIFILDRCLAATKRRLDEVD